MDFKIEEVVEQIRVVDEKRDYWMIRSYGGELYDDFYERNYVGLGFNEIPYEYITEASKNDEATFLRLRNSISSKYNLPKSEVTRWANQLIDFQKEVRDGDIVITPSRNSDQYAFGVVLGDTYITKEKGTFKFKDEFEPFPEKRKKIHWLKKIHKDDLNGDLKGLSSQRMPLTNAYKYRDVIEGYLSAVYIKEDKIYITIQIDQDEDINAFAFNDFLGSLTYFYKEFCKENGVEDNEELFLKIKVQSKGKMALKALSVTAGVGLTLLFVLSDNPEIKLNLLNIVKLEGKSTGLLKSYTNFLNANAERQRENQRFQDSMNRLKAKPIEKSIKPADDNLHESQLRLHSKLHQEIPNKKNDISLSDTTVHREKPIEPGEQRQQSDRPNKRND